MSSTSSGITTQPSTNGTIAGTITYPSSPYYIPSTAPGTITYPPQPNQIPNNPYIYPNSNQIAIPGSYSLRNNSTSTVSINANSPYHVMLLPVKRIPKMIYVNGRLLTFGVLGSNAECAYAGNGKLVFSPGIINAISYLGKTSISLQYRKKLYHYSVNYNSAETLLNCILLSEILL